jgi:apolipoprotein N-acyltransferase
LSYPFLALATAGFIAMLWLHVASLFGAVYLVKRSLSVLVPGLFVAFVPTVFVMYPLTRDARQSDLWRAALRGCPRWMRGFVWAIFGYSWGGFFVLPFLFGGGMEANGMRVISAGLLAFYLIPVAVLYSAMQVRRSGESTGCVNGHRVSPFAKFCEECGAPVATDAQPSRR